MTIKDDMLRALEYGKTPYYNAIIEVPSYQAELDRVVTDYNERTWIDFRGFYPKFTTKEFEERRVKYQAKYGNVVNVPGFSDLIHIVPKAKISAEERAAHLWATKRGLPSPLTPAQIESMQYKKFRFIKALASATPAWMRTYGAVATTLDNIEDGLVTIVVLGRIAARIAPKLLGRMIPGLGWVLLGSDIFNAVNILSYAGFAAKGAKRNAHALAEKNPFHAKAKARRTLKLKKAIPGFGEYLEVLQTTDQLFGVGLCLGGLMGMVTDSAAAALNPNYWINLNRILTTGNPNDVYDWITRSVVWDVYRVKKTLEETFDSLMDEANRLKIVDQKLREEIFAWTEAKSKETWGWVKSIPGAMLNDFSKSVIGSMILNTGKDDFTKEDHTNSLIMLDQSIQGLMPWWIENNPLENFKDLRSLQFKAPSPTDPTTIDMLNEHNPEWKNTVKWPHLDKEYATIEEIALTYAPMIKDSFQTYALNYPHDYEAMVASQQVVEFTKDVIRSFSDDNEVTVGLTAYAWVAEDMMREIYLIPPDTPENLVGQLADYVGNYERETGVAPPIKDVANKGKSIGIDWMRTFPKRAFDAAAEIFPEWQTIQDQLDELFVAD